MVRKNFSNFLYFHYDLFCRGQKNTPAKKKHSTFSKSARNPEFVFPGFNTDNCSIPFTPGASCLADEDQEHLNFVYIAVEHYVVLTSVMKKKC